MKFNRAAITSCDILPAALVLVLWWVCLTFDGSVWLAAGVAVYSGRELGIRFYLMALLATGIAALVAGLNVPAALALIVATACAIIYARSRWKYHPTAGSNLTRLTEIATDVIIPAAIFSTTYAILVRDWTPLQTLPAVGSGLMMLAPMQHQKQIHWPALISAGLASLLVLILAESTGITALTVLIGSFALLFLSQHKAPDVWSAALAGTAIALSLINLTGGWITDSMVFIASIAVYFAGTHAQEVRNQLAEAEDRIMRRNNRMRYLLNERDEVTALAVHDLQSPIQAIGGLQETLLHMLNTGKQDPANMRQALEVAIRTSHDLSDRIGSILSSKRPHLGGQREVSDLSELVRDVVALHQIRISEGGIHIETSVPEVSVTDAEEVKDILDVLLDNAITHTDQGCTISFSGSVNETQQTVKLRLTDTGPGISADTIDKIMVQPSDTNTHGKRQGIGLYLAQRRLRKLAGYLDVSSPESGGACFEITLPLTDRRISI